MHEATRNMTFYNPLSRTTMPRDIPGTVIHAYAKGRVYLWSGAPP